MKFYYLGYGEPDGPFLGAVIVPAKNLSEAAIRGACVCSEELDGEIASTGLGRGVCTLNRALAGHPSPFFKATLGVPWKE